MTFVFNVEFDRYEGRVEWVHNDIMQRLQELKRLVDQEVGVTSETYCDEMSIDVTTKDYQDSLDRENYIEDTKI
jgi:hypothetical protein